MIRPPPPPPPPPPTEASNKDVSRFLYSGDDRYVVVVFFLFQQILIINADSPIITSDPKIAFCILHKEAIFSKINHSFSAKFSDSSNNLKTSFGIIATWDLRKDCTGLKYQSLPTTC